MTELIEDYLHSAGTRYFRGHHENDFFYLVSTQHGRLHVHLEAFGAPAAAITINITPCRYYPADNRDQLWDLVTDWNAGSSGAEAMVHESSDPALVGAIVRNQISTHGAVPGDLIEGTVRAASSLFGQISRALTLGTADMLLDTG